METRRSVRDRLRGPILAITWRIGDGVLELVLIGDYTLEQFASALAAIAASPDLQPETGFVVDGRSSLAYFSPEEIVDRSYHLGRLVTRARLGRTAFIAKDEPMRLRFARGACDRFAARGLAAAVFTDRAEPARWARRRRARSGS